MYATYFVISHETKQKAELQLKGNRLTDKKPNEKTSKQAIDNKKEENKHN